MRRAWILPAAGVGFAAGAAVTDVPYLHMGREVDPVGLATLFAGVVVSFLLLRGQERVKHSDQLAKEAVLLRLSECMARVETVESLCRDNYASYDQMVRANNACMRSFSGCADYADALSCGFNRDDARKFEAACRRVWSLTTNTDRASEPVKQLEIDSESGLLRFHRDRLADVVSALDDVKQHLYEVKRQVILNIG